MALKCLGTAVGFMLPMSMDGSWDKAGGQVRIQRTQTSSGPTLLPVDTAIPLPSEVAVVSCMPPATVFTSPPSFPPSHPSFLLIESKSLMSAYPSLNP